jgi:hypothetical protein
MLMSLPTLIIVVLLAVLILQDLFPVGTAMATVSVK